MFISLLRGADRRRPTTVRARYARGWRGAIMSFIATVLLEWVFSSFPSLGRLLRTVAEGRVDWVLANPHLVEVIVFVLLWLVVWRALFCLFNPLMPSRR